MLVHAVVHAYGAGGSGYGTGTGTGTDGYGSGSDNGASGQFTCQYGPELECDANGDLFCCNEDAGCQSYSGATMCPTDTESSMCCVSD
jgi:hypothetical protein